jgi:hypothetical protein
LNIDSRHIVNSAALSGVIPEHWRSRRDGLWS